MSTTEYGNQASVFLGQRWSGLVTLFATLLVAFTSFAQPPTRDQLVGTWIGVRMDYDDQISSPYPAYMRLHADSTYSLGLIDENPLVQQAIWSISPKTIRLDTLSFALNQWALSANELRLKGPFPMLFRRMTNVAIDSAAAWQTLAGYEWETDSLTYLLHRTGAACLKNPKTGSVASHCWRLATIDQSVFLVVKGNANGCEGNFQYPLQIVHMSPDKIECLGGVKGTDRFIFKRKNALTASISCEQKGFQPCNTFASAVTNLYPYFSFLRGRLYTIRQIVEREYKPVLKAGESGLVRFRFMVNCHGDAGNFEVLEVDENYQKKAFSSQIVNQLRTICSTKLSNWEAGKRNEDQIPDDTVCLLTFRLKDGLITDIFP